jgi:tetratricopeptide (TPR) repeat protein
LGNIFSLSEEVFVAQPSKRYDQVPPEISFVTLPLALAQFHHLPTHVPVWLHKEAKAKEKGYDFSEGVGAMESLLEAAPQVPGAYLFQLFVRKWPKLMEVNPYFASGRIAEAIPKLVEVLNIDPECPLTCFQLGFCFRATGELDKSESFYKQALRMAPDAGWIYSNLGRTYLAQGDKLKAAEAFWAALRLLPGDHFVVEQLVNMGELFVLEGADEKGKDSALFVKRADYEKKMREILEKETHGGRLMGLGWRLLNDSLLDLAQACFEKAKAVNPPPRDVLLGLSILNLQAGRYPEAEKGLCEFLDENPESALGHLNLFKAYLAQDEMDLAWDEIQTAVKLDPGRLEVLRQLFYFFRESDRWEEGVDWLKELSKEHPDLSAPLLVIGQAQSEKDLWNEAEDTLKEALRRTPHNEEVLLYYTSELGRRGKREELIRLLQAEPAPLSFSLTLNWALAYSHSGQAKEAKKLMKDFLKRPDVTPLEKNRAEAILKELE